MIMKKLTPDQALKAFIDGREVYTMRRLEPTTTIEELANGDGFVTFEETPVQPETAQPANETTADGETPAETEEPAESPETGRNEATAEPEAETVAKKSKGIRADHETIMEMWRQGWTVKQISETVGCSDQTVRNHIARG